MCPRDGRGEKEREREREILMETERGGGSAGERGSMSASSMSARSSQCSKLYPDRTVSGKGGDSGCHSTIRVQLLRSPERCHSEPGRLACQLLVPAR